MKIKITYSKGGEIRNKNMLGKTFRESLDKAKEYCIRLNEKGKLVQILTIHIY